MLNSTDLKDSNNSIYEVDGAAGTAPARWFVVRDLGAALGETGKLYPRRNWLEGFEQQRLHHRACRRRRVEFDYDGRHQELLSMIAPGRRTVGRAAHVAADRRAVARRVPRRQLRRRRRPTATSDGSREDCRRPRASRRPPRVAADERR